MTVDSGTVADVVEALTLSAYYFGASAVAGAIALAMIAAVRRTSLGQRLGL